MAAIHSSLMRLAAPTPLKKIAAGLATATILGLIGSLQAAHADINVPLSAGQSSNKMPIAVSDFSGSNGVKAADIIAADLERSGIFEVERVRQDFATDSNGAPNWSAISEAGVSAPIAIGSVNGNQITYTLADPAQQAKVDNKSVSESNQRRQAHRIADAIFESQTGVRGVFSTKIAYAGGNQLVVADADGENKQVVASSKSSIISPAWSPDGSKIAYVAFDEGKPVVYIQNLATGQRSVAANFKGNNSAPAFSPDGSRLAVALSRDNLSNIYTIPANGGTNATQITNSPQIDTEPSFFPNGSGIVFTSDRGGSAQIYRTGLNGGSASRITFNGKQNVSGKVSPDGSKLVYSSLRGGSYSIAISGIGTGSDQVLTSGPNDLSPSFAPNGMQILYVSSSGLGLVNADGSFQTSIPASGGLVSAAWGPFVD
ncbi:Tol-Pal system beta propeller repeat protein TolB [Brackiella oedipodis]|uniref:Tol-Pal system beta propeller repeat protein TolB n=1 Tax=Brackiella oedipodis TaxID=124225 RepID=UPI000A897B60|nr:Tol-Pal system beta propeller repeat protein TolB [Brackiella oedipodis]